MEPRQRINTLINRLLDSLDLDAKISQLDLALTTSIPRFLGVPEDRFRKVHQQKGTAPDILELILNLESYQVLDEEGSFSVETARKMLVEDGFGSIWGLVQGGSPAQNHRAANELQRISCRDSGSKLPLIIAEEGLHGLLAPGSTVFPQSGAIGATFSPLMAEEIAYAIGREAAFRGVNAIFAPVLDLALDARWGRCEETFGSDPRLVSDLGAAFVRGLRKAGVAPIVKHFCGHGWVCGGRDSNDNGLSIRELRRLHLPPFQAAVKAGALGIMSAYHAVDGLPCTANHLLLTTILREELQFEGLVISDAGAVEDLERKYGLASDLQSCIAMAHNAGLDIHNNGPGFKEGFLEMLNRGQISIETLDQSVARVLYVKEQLGLLSEIPPQDEFDECVWKDLRAAHGKLALDAARNSLALLKNASHILPLDPDRYRKIYVSGLLAEAPGALLGDYAPGEAKPPSILDGLIRWAPDGCEVEYLPELGHHPEFAGEAQVLIVVAGESSAFGPEMRSGEGCDRASIELPQEQKSNLDAAIKTGIPVVLLILAGRPLALEDELDCVDSLLYCFFPGEHGGRAIAETIFGMACPQGNLPYDLPRKTGQVPIYYHQLPSGRSRDYCDSISTPLFPFGFGLRYTEFDLEDLKVDVIQEAPDPVVNLSISVGNVGNKASQALVQVYCRDIVSSVITPERRLVAYHKVPLDPGKRSCIEFTLGFDAFAFLDNQHVWRVDPGEFEILVGFSSGEILLREIVSL